MFNLSQPQATPSPSPTPTLTPNATSSFSLPSLSFSGGFGGNNAQPSSTLAAPTPAGTPTASPSPSPSPSFGNLQFPAATPVMGTGTAPPPSPSPSSAGLGMFGSSFASQPNNSTLSKPTPSLFAPALGTTTATTATQGSTGGGLFGAQQTLSTNTPFNAFNNINNNTNSNGSTFSLPLAAPSSNSGFQQTSNIATTTAPRHNLDSEFATIEAAYNAQSPYHRFHYIFYDLDVPMQNRVKPQTIDDARWNEALEARERYLSSASATPSSLPSSAVTTAAGVSAAGRGISGVGAPTSLHRDIIDGDGMYAYIDPERLWPVLISGFDSLVARMRQQDEAIMSDREYLQSIVNMERSIQSHIGNDVRGRVAELKRMHQEHTHVLIRIMRKLEAIARAQRSRYTMNNSTSTTTLTSQAQESSFTGIKSPATSNSGRVDDYSMLARVSNLEKSVDPIDPNSLTSRVRVVASDVKYCTSNGNKALIQHSTSHSTGATLDSASEEKLMKILSQQTDAVRKLDEALRKDVRDITIMTS